LRDSLPIDVLLSAVSVLVVAQSSSEVPEGLMNNPVLRPEIVIGRVEIITSYFFTLLPLQSFQHMMFAHKMCKKCVTT